MRVCQRGVARRDVCYATTGGFRDPVCRPWEDRTQPLVPALDGTGSPDGQPADLPSELAVYLFLSCWLCLAALHVLSGSQKG
jgi:hypothetical protein